MTLTPEERDYVLGLLSREKASIQKLLQSIESMGENPYINDGLLNEGLLKKQILSRELALNANLILKLQED